MATLRSFEELKCWQACRSFRLFVHGLVKRFPKEEQFLLTAQLKDSSRRTTHNIAEGFGRDNAQDNARFYRTSRGSLMEAMDQLITANDEGLITNEELVEGRRFFTDARARLEGYIDYLTKARRDNMLREPLVPYGAMTEEDGIWAYLEPVPIPNPQPSVPTSNPQPAEA
ncbi:MAG: four helix bundle protein [Flavobacteriales bacterium]|nr:four helix bundle protein [Flavobacteriales bacterium]